MPLIPSPPIETRFPGRREVISPGIYGQAGPWIAPPVDRSTLDLVAEVWVDDDFSEGNAGGHTWATDAFATIREGIAAADAGATVHVYPGIYHETTPGCYLFDASGPHQFGLFLPASKPGIIIEGVDGAGSAIVDYHSIAAEVLYTAVSASGTSGVFVEADSATITGLWIHNEAAQEVDQTFEIIGDGFTLRYCKIDDWDQTYWYGGSTSFFDWRYDTVNAQSHIRTYSVEYNFFPRNNTIDIANGTGYGWPASGRVIRFNDFDSNLDIYSSCSFTGTVPAIGWYVYPVGGAVIAGNTFSNGASQYLTARGVYDDAQFDWAAYWNDNTFDRKVAHGSNPPGVLAEYTSDVYEHTRRIGTVIADEIFYATAGETVLIGGGGYVENLLVNKSISLTGSGAAATTIYPAVSDPGPCGGASFQNSQVLIVAAHDVTISDLTIDGDNPALAGGIADGAVDINARNGIIEADGPWNNLVVHHCTAKNLYYRGIYARSGGSGFHFHHNTVLNLDACPYGIGLYNFGGSGIIEDNAVAYCGDAIAANGSRGTQFLRNVVTNSSSGVHTDNSVGPIADQIRNNQVSAGGPNSYGVWVFFPAVNTTLDSNQVTNNDVGLFAWGGVGGVSQFTSNFVDGQNRPNSVGIAVTPGPDSWASWQADVACDFSGNTTANCTYGFDLETDEDGGFATTVTSAAYSQTGHSYDIYVAGLGALSYSGLGGHTVVVGFPARAQDGIDLALGSTVYLAAGTYVGQLHIANHAELNLIGAGIGSTVVRAPATAMPLYFPTPVYNYPIIFCDHSTVHISDLTVDGDGKGNLNQRFHGIGFWNSAGSVTDCYVTRVRNTPLNEAPGGIGIYANGSLPGPYAVAVTGCTIDDCQKGGITLNGASTLGTVSNCSVTLAGPTAAAAQNGIQFGFGASGTISGSTSSGCAYLPSGTLSCGYLFYEAGPVNVTNSGGSNNQIGAYYVETSGSYNGGTFSSASGITYYSAGVGADNRSLTTGRRNLSPLVDPVPGHGPLDAAQDEVVSFSNLTVIGTTPVSVNSWGIDVYSSSFNVDVTVTDNVVTNWDKGISLDIVSPGTINIGTITGNRMTNTNNALDDSPGHSWNGNCYSDYALNSGFGFGRYDIPNAGNQDPNPNPNGCSNVDLALADPTIGCVAGDSCNVDVLHVMIDRAALTNLRLVFQLPSGFQLLDPANGAALPQAPADSNTVFAQVNALAGDSFELDIAWDGFAGGSSGNPAQKVASIPLRNVGAVSGSYKISGAHSLWIDTNGGQHTDDMILSAISVIVDCTPPTITSFSNPATCSAFGSALLLIDKLTVVLDRGVDGSALDSAWVTFSPGGYSFPLFGSNPVSNPYTVTFPDAGSAAAFYANLLNNGCTTLTLHVRDARCNEAATVDLVVGRDETAPSLAVSNGTPPNFCFNNAAGANFGGSELDNYLDVTWLPGTDPCHAATGTLHFAHAGVPDWVAEINDSGYPGSDSTALELWNWMLTVPGLATANGDSFTFDVRAEDCAGNTSGIQQFTICVDTQAPENTIAAFDARPAHNGVWLNWSWAAGSQAQELRVYRSALSGEYPGYPNALWNSDANYPTATVPPAGWTLVAAQSALSGMQTSAGMVAANNRGDFHQHITDSDTFWLDADAGWIDGDGNASTYRDIYRYLTFVRDAGGNWSTGFAPTMGVNADRSTNYWLGDFSTADGVGPTSSRGRVDSDDLTLLSVVYFSSVVGDFRNIGPVLVENGGVGKGIPTPDVAGTIDFSDLVPMTFNYNMVAPVGNPLEFWMAPLPEELPPFDRLDQAPPGIAISIPDESALGAGDEFTVALTLSGNTENRVKAAEAELQFDPSVYGFVSSTSGDVRAAGELFFKVAEVAGHPGRLGIIAASCGGRTTLTGDGTIAAITLRVRSADPARAQLSLAAIKLLSNTGATLEMTGNVLNVGSSAMLPQSYALYQNYPNPFNPTTNIRFDLKEAGRVTLMVHNVLGQAVATVLDQHLDAGRHQVTFDAGGLSSGLYVYSISVNGFTDLRKLVLMR
ncbi:T9SS type A sorting domain-containing protein [candidate division KSB1 bacterium]|nr:T9SS type A sorting domain-containing protein [candidate division KSB1 bacterium]